MCIILDANVLNDLVNKNSDGHSELDRLAEWFEDGGKFAYTDFTKMKSEYHNASRKFKDFFDERDLGGYVKKFDKEDIKAQVKKLNQLKSKLKPRSNDAHIIALAQVAGVRVLVSRDKKLCKDFIRICKNVQVYEKSDHEEVLANCDCP